VCSGLRGLVVFKCTPTVSLSRFRSSSPAFLLGAPELTCTCFFSPLAIYFPKLPFRRCPPRFCRPYFSCLFPRSFARVLVFFLKVVVFSLPYSRHCYHRPVFFSLPSISFSFFSPNLGCPVFSWCPKRDPCQSHGDRDVGPPFSFLHAFFLFACFPSFPLHCFFSPYRFLCRDPPSPPQVFLVRFPVVFPIRSCRVYPPPAFQRPPAHPHRVLGFFLFRCPLFFWARF